MHRTALLFMLLSVFVLPVLAHITVPATDTWIAYKGAISNAGGHAKSIGQWREQVAQAYSNNLGMVWTFEETTTPAWAGNSAETNFTLQYGIDLSAELAVTTSYQVQHATFSTAGSTSGDSVCRKGSANQGNDHSFELYPPGDARVTAAGVCVIERTGTFSPAPPTIGITAIFTDGTSNTLTQTIPVPDQTVDESGGWFYYFEAPSGHAITRLDFFGDNSLRANPYDDMGFVLVPEPAVAVVAGLAVLLAARRGGR